MLAREVRRINEQVAALPEPSSLARLLAARIVIGESASYRAMATLISPSLALTPLHVISESGALKDPYRKIMIECLGVVSAPIRATLLDSDEFVDFAVLHLAKPVTFHVPSNLIRAHALPIEGIWQSYWVTEYEHGRLSVYGRLEGRVMLSGRSYLRISLLESLAEADLGERVVGAPVVVEDKLVGIVARKDVDRFFYAISTADMVKSKQTDAVRAFQSRLAGPIPDKTEVSSTDEPSGPSSWITQETFDRFSKEAVALLSRADRIGRKTGRIHTGHLLQGFREKAAHEIASPPLTAFLKENDANLMQVLDSAPVIPKVAPRPLKKPPKVSDNVRSALLTAIEKAGTTGPIEDSHILFGVLSTVANARVRELNKRGMTPDKVPLPVHPPPVEKSAAPSLSAPTPKIVSDLWAEEDLLGYGAYARTLASVIAHEETVPPLSIGIKAPWGAGKTSLMKQLQHILDGEADVTEENKAATINKGTSQIALTISELWKKLSAEIQIERPAPKASKLGELYGIPPRITVWFNAWKYQTSEQIWAGLAHCIISQVTARMDTHQRESFWLKLHARRVNKEAVRRKVYGLMLRYLAPIAFIGLLCSAIAVWMLSPFSQAIIPFLGIKVWWTKLVLPFFTVVGLLWKARDKLGEKAADAFKDIVREPDYEGKMGFLHLVESDIRDVLNLVATKKTPLVIFVDDLDRCVPRKVAEVVEAINLSLCGDYPNCIFVLGMEPGMVAAALEVANKEVIEKAKELSLLDTTIPLGWRFMEKIVQLPINIPPPTEAGLRGYAASLTGGVHSTERKGSKEAEVPTESLPAKEKVEEWKAKLETSNTVGDVVNLTERLMAAAPAEERLAVAEASKQKYAEKFIDRDPLVSKFVEEVFSLVGGNPRQIKRYINVFRFHSTLRHNLKVDLAARGLQATLPSDKGLAKFIAMAIQWPHAAEFLRRTRIAGADGKGQAKPESLLKLLEKKSQTIKGQRQKADAAWVEFLKSVELEQVEWIAMRSFREFLAQGEALSEIEGCGLW